MAKKILAQRSNGDVVEVELPRCPDCGATGKRCRRPSGDRASEWHPTRKALLGDSLGAPAPAAEERFTATEDLLLDLLAARYRLGEHQWSVRRGLTAVRTLTERGLITSRSHNASPKHIYVSLTERGRKAAMYDGYTAPKAGK